jgi:hypothetical protein
VPVNQREHRCGERGATWVRTTLLVVFAGVSAFAVATALDVLYRFYDLRNGITFALRAADLESDQELRRKMAASVIGAGIRCDERDILIARSGRLVRAELPYRHWVGIPFAREHRGLFSLALRASGERAL